MNFSFGTGSVTFCPQVLGNLGGGVAAELPLWKILGTSSLTPNPTLLFPRVQCEGFSACETSHGLPIVASGESGRAGVQQDIRGQSWGKRTFSLESGLVGGCDMGAGTKRRRWILGFFGGGGLGATPSSVVTHGRAQETL